MPIKHLVLLECIICTVSCGLPKADLKMDAVNTQYLLRWNWTDSTSVNFTAQFAFSNSLNPESQNGKNSFKDVCSGFETFCDYSDHLDYSGEYVLRVRAETREQRSDWAMLKFCPDVDANLGAPSELRLEAGVSLVTVSFKEPMAENGEPMSSVLGQNTRESALAFRLRFWKEDAPSQYQEKKFNTTLHTLSLSTNTRYCLKVQAFSDAFGKTSPYTPPQCTTTLGPTFVWQIVVPLSLLAVFLGVCCFLWTRKRRSLVLPYTLPSSLMLHNKFHQPLLVPKENSCAVTAVVAVPTAEPLLQLLDRPTPIQPTAIPGLKTDSHNS